MSPVQKLYVSPRDAGRSKVQVELKDEKERVAEDSHPGKLLLCRRETDMEP